MIKNILKLTYKVVNGKFIYWFYTRPIISKILKYIFSSASGIYKCKYGVKLELPQDDAFISGYMFLGESSPIETDWFRKFIRKGDFVVQAGAYRDGWYAILAEKMKARGFCIEPVFAADLCQNLTRNGVGHIPVYAGAVGDRNGTADISLSMQETSIITNVGSHKQTVPLCTLDKAIKDFCPSEKRIRVAILDIEGYEFATLKSSPETVEKTDAMIVEVVDKYLAIGKNTRNEFIEWMKDKGFNCYRIGQSGIVKYDGQDSRTPNYIFIRES